MCVCVCLFVCLCVCVSVCLSVSLSVCLSVCSCNSPFLCKGKEIVSRVQIWRIHPFDGGRQFLCQILVDKMRTPRALYTTCLFTSLFTTNDKHVRYLYHLQMRWPQNNRGAWYDRQTCHVTDPLRNCVGYVRSQATMVHGARGTGSEAAI